MTANTDISRIAIVGSGLIGSSWAACFLAHGLDVVATDPEPGSEDRVRQYVETAWPALTKFGLTPGASTSRLRFTADLKEAVAGADLDLRGSICAQHLGMRRHNKRRVNPSTSRHIAL